MMQFFARPKLFGLGLASAGLASSVESDSPPRASPPTRSSSRRSSDDDPQRLSMACVLAVVADEPRGSSPRARRASRCAINHKRVYHTLRSAYQTAPPDSAHPAAHAARLASTMRSPLLAVLVALVSPALARAGGFVESISPPVVEVGKVTRVTFHGRDLA